MKKLYLLVFTLLIANMLSGQNIKRYEGKMKLPSDLDQLKGVITETYPAGMRSLAGDGYYDYYEDADEDRIKHGKYYLKLSSYKISGTYKHGKKEGQWIIEAVDNNTTKYSRTISLKITYKDDVLNGPCVLVTLPDLITVYSYCTINCNFKNGILVGDVSLINEVSPLLGGKEKIISNCQGKITEDGLLAGVWNIHDKGGIETTQKKVYYKGALLYIEEKDFSTGEKTICYSAFDNLKKTPQLELLRDTIVFGQESVVYNGQIAVKTSTPKYPSHVYSSPILVISALPKSLSQSELIKQQSDSWRYAYSSEKYNELIESKRQAQKEIEESAKRKEEEVFTVVEEMPEFPGGMTKLSEYLTQNMKYPELAKTEGIQGRVFVNFIIEPDGSTSNVCVVRSIGGGCDEEAVRLIESMPKWKPGTQRGKAVRVSYNIPIFFKL